MYFFFIFSIKFKAKCDRASLLRFLLFVLKVLAIVEINISLEIKLRQYVKSYDLVG